MNRDVYEIEGNNEAKIRRSKNNEQNTGLTIVAQKAYVFLSGLGTGVFVNDIMDFLKTQNLQMCEKIVMK